MTNPRANPVTRRHLATLAGWGLGLGLGVAAAVGGWWYLGAPGWPVTPGPAPEVSYTLLDGQKTSTGQLKGQVVLVNFWSTSCSTCITEMPQVAATFEKFRGRGFQTVAVAMEYDAPALVSDFAIARKLPFGVAIDNTGEIAERFGKVRLTPTSFLIDKRGLIVQRWTGAPDFAALQKMVEKLLAEA